MAQAGYTPIQLYYSSTTTNAPTAGNLASGELAINITDGKLFYKDNGGSVQVIAWKTTPTTAGGTGLTSWTAGDLPYYATGTTLSKLGIGTAGQVLTSTGTAPQWSTLSGVAVTTFSAGTTGFTPSSATSGAVTLAGTLATTNGGTGLTSFTANGVVYASSSSALTTGSALTFSGGVFGVSDASSPRVSVEGSSTASGYLIFKNTTSGFNRGYVGYEFANDAMPFAVSGSEQMRLTSTGLKVGTTSDFSGAKVVTDGGGIGILNKGLLRSSTNGVLQVSADPNNAYASSQISFDVDGSTVATLDSSGNLGIGTSSPTGRLHISTASGNTDFVHNVTGAGTAARTTYQRSGSVVFYAGLGAWSGTDTYQIASTSGPLTTIDTSGNLGIGTTSPQGKVESKTATILPAVAAYSQKAFVANIPYATSNITSSLLAGYDSSIFGVNVGYSYDGAGYYLAFATNNTTSGTPTERARITSGGTFQLTNNYQEGVLTANTGTAYTIDLVNGTLQILTLTGNCTFTFPTATAGQSFTMLLRQDGTGGRTVTWPAAVRWPGNTAPTITSTASQTDKYIFTADGTRWYGSNAGQAYVA